ncbi:hypothetical protein EI938_23705, partial [Salmonella enterica]|nr:hypothetical protein [Salmonella enterica]
DINVINSILFINHLIKQDPHQYIELPHLTFRISHTSTHPHANTLLKQPPLIYIVIVKGQHLITYQI